MLETLFGIAIGKQHREAFRSSNERFRQPAALPRAHTGAGIAGPGFYFPVQTQGIDRLLQVPGGIAGQRTQWGNPEYS